MRIRSLNDFLALLKSAKRASAEMEFVPNDRHEKDKPVPDEQMMVADYRSRLRLFRGEICQEEE